jgi:hypothetical protein
VLPLIGTKRKFYYVSNIMSNKALKERLHQQIEVTDSDELLNLVSDILEGKYPFHGKYILSDEEMAILNHRDRVKEPGNYYTTDQLEERLSKWLSK